MNLGFTSNESIVVPGSNLNARFPDAWEGVGAVRCSRLSLGQKNCYDILHGS